MKNARNLSYSATLHRQVLRIEQEAGLKAWFSQAKAEAEMLNHSRNLKSYNNEFALNWKI